MIPLLLYAALSVGAPSQGVGVNIYYPTTVFGDIRVAEVERVAARFEQARRLREVQLRKIDTEGDNASLTKLCDADGSDVLFINPLLLTMLTKPPRFQVRLSATYVRCSDKDVRTATRISEMPATTFSDPSVATAFKNLEANVIHDLIDQWHA